MPESGQAESKPEEPKPGEKPSEAKASGNWRGKGYVDYEKLSPEDAAIMLKRIRKRMSRVMRDLEVVMSILMYGANAQGQGQRYQRQGKGYGYRKYGYSGRNYNRQYKRHSENEDEDVNYD